MSWNSLLKWHGMAWLDGTHVSTRDLYELEQFAEMAWHGMAWLDGTHVSTRDLYELEQFAEMAWHGMAWLDGTHVSTRVLPEEIYSRWQFKNQSIAVVLMHSYDHVK